MTQQMASRMAGISGFLAVALGAFGAHALKDMLADRQMTGIWETAVLYHLVHAAALLLAPVSRGWRGPHLWWSLGILIFSGSLYLMAFTQQRWLGAITPIGGVMFLAGWLSVILGAGNASPAHVSRGNP